MTLAHVRLKTSLRARPWRATVAQALAAALWLIAAACGGQSHQPTSPTSPGGPIAVSACSLLLSNSTYALTQDVSSTSAPCISIQSATSVQLDCQRHVVSSISVVGGGRIAIANCTVTGATFVSTSNSVSITQSTLSGGLGIDRTTAAVVDHATISAPSTATVAVAITSSNGSQLTNSAITLANNGGFETVYLAAGSGNQVVHNTITSAYAATLSKAGADDGVLLDDESGDTISGNSISGFWDAGVEGIDTLAGTSIVDNTISKIGTAAFGAYWCTNWTNNTVEGNDVSSAPRLALVFYATGTPQCATPFPAPVFSGNQFVDNRFHDVIAGLGFVNIPKMSVVFASGFVANNLLQGNDFGTNDGPFLSPLSGFVDGGGNVCGPMNPSLTNFDCTGGTSSIRRARRR